MHLITWLALCAIPVTPSTPSTSKYNPVLTYITLPILESTYTTTIYGNHLWGYPHSLTLPLIPTKKTIKTSHTNVTYRKEDNKNELINSHRQLVVYHPMDVCARIRIRIRNYTNESNTTSVTPVYICTTTSNTRLCVYEFDLSPVTPRAVHPLCSESS